MISRYPFPLRLAELLEEVSEAASEGLGVQLRQWDGQGGGGQGGVPPLRGDGNQAKSVVRGQLCGRQETTTRYTISSQAYDDDKHPL